MSEAVKSTGQPDESANQGQKQGQNSGKRRNTDAMSRIKLALLEQYSRGAEKHGADPYNTKDGNGPAKDAWSGNSRRI